MFDGLIEVRPIVEKGIAFVEFSNDDYANYAMSHLRKQGGLEI